MSKTITIQQIKSAARRPSYQTETLKGLKLNKVGRTAEVPDNPAMRGRVESVAHLVRIVEKK